MSSSHYSPFTKRLRSKLNATLAETMLVQRAFVEALKEEVEERFRASQSDMVKLTPQPLVIAGLGSFKMRTRPQRIFDDPNGRSGIDTVAKAPARRLVFKSKWEEIK